MYPLNEQQRLQYIETHQLWDNYQHARQQVQSYKYGMKWGKAKGREYLIRLQDAQGRGKSMGARSTETEAIYLAFQLGKERSAQRFSQLKQQLAEQARMNKAVRLSRIPQLIARILREMDQRQLFNEFCILGTHALWAYEAMAGVQCKAELLASGDIDLLYDPRKKLSLTCRKLEKHGLMGLLQRIDSSFIALPGQTFRAANADRFMVDLILPPTDMRQPPMATFSPDDLSGVEVPSLEWLINAPKISVMAIGMDGGPVPLKVPSPQAFAIHKAWLSQQPGRDPVKRPRDLAQAKLVLQLLHAYLPQYPLDPQHLRFFPAHVIASASLAADELAGL